MKNTFQQKLDAFLNRYCELYRFSGILRVTHQDEILYEKCIGFADIEHQIPITPQSVFTLYSLSKPFCAIGLLHLVDQGLVDLDAHPGQYVPEAKNFDSRVTLRHILHHAGGLPDFTAYDNEVRATYLSVPFDLRKIIALLAQKPLRFVPGTSMEYANINFALPALIIENVTGRPYADYMREEVFLPLGMKTAVVDDRHRLIPHRVRGYEISGEEWIDPGRDMELMFGAGDIVAGAEDVYCLNLAIKQKKLLRPETWQQVLTPAFENNPFGMGCAIVEHGGRRLVQHNGGHLGFRTLHQQYLEEDFDIILLSNCGFGNSRSTISDAVFAAFFGEEKSCFRVKMDAGYISELSAGDGQYDGEDLLPVPPTKIPLSPQKEAALLGDYGAFRLEKQNGRYFLRYQKGTWLEVYPTDRQSFAACLIDEEYPVGSTANGIPTFLGIPKKNN